MNYNGGIHGKIWVNYFFFISRTLVVRGCLIVAPTIPFGESYLKYITLYHTFAPILTTTMSNGLI